MLPRRLYQRPLGRPVRVSGGHEAGLHAPAFGGQCVHAGANEVAKRPSPSASTVAATRRASSSSSTLALRRGVGLRGEHAPRIEPVPAAEAIGGRVVCPWQDRRESDAVPIAAFLFRPQGRPPW